MVSFMTSLFGRTKSKIANPQQKMRKSKKNRISQKKSSYTYRCTQCGCEEAIPKGVVDFLFAGVIASLVLI